MAWCKASLGQAGQLAGGHWFRNMQAVLKDVAPESKFPSVFQSGREPKILPLLEKELLENLEFRHGMNLRTAIGLGSPPANVGKDPQCLERRAELSNKAKCSPGIRRKRVQGRQGIQEGDLARMQKALGQRIGRWHTNATKAPGAKALLTERFRPASTGAGPKCVAPTMQGRWSLSGGG